MKVVKRESQANIVVVAMAYGWKGEKKLKMRSLKCRVKANSTELWEIENGGGLHDWIVEKMEKDLRDANPKQSWSVSESWTRSPNV